MPTVIFKCIIFWLFCLISSAMLLAQEMVFSTQIAAGAVSISRHAHVYVADAKGNIHKYDTTGKLLNTFSPQKLGQVNTLESWNGLRTLVFYRDFQEYMFLDRFLTYNPRNVLPADVVGFARCLTSAADENLWLIDDQDFSLKKLDAYASKLIFSTPLDLILPKRNYQFSFMRDYQNNLYVLDSISGILVFDNMGNYKKLIPAKTNFFSFDGDEMYWLNASGTIETFNLYSFKKGKIELPKTSDKVHYCLKMKKYLFLFSANQMHIFKN